MKAWLTMTILALKEKFGFSGELEMVIYALNICDFKLGWLAAHKIPFMGNSA